MERSLDLLITLFAKSQLSASSSLCRVLGVNPFLQNPKYAHCFLKTGSRVISNSFDVVKPRLVFSFQFPIPTGDLLQW